jgi:hypothetical protein
MQLVRLFAISMDHGRVPSTTSTYRVRAFNPRGVSAWSATASGVTRRLAEPSPPPHSETMATCTTLDAETARIAEDGWPVVRASAHESAVASRVAVHVFLHGEYLAVDGYLERSSNAPVAWTEDGATPEEDPTRWAPPFLWYWQQ